MKKSYGVKDLSKVKPIEFTLGDRTFHVPRKARPDVVQMMAAAITLDENGVRHYPVQVLRTALIVLVAEELWDEAKGEWVRVDEGEAIADLFRSPRYEITPDVLGELVCDIVEETTGFPTGAPKPSSGSSAGAEQK